MTPDVAPIETVPIQPQLQTSSIIRVRLGHDGVLSFHKPPNVIWTSAEYSRLSTVPGRRARGQDVAAYPSALLGEWLDKWDVVDCPTKETAECVNRIIDEGRSHSGCRQCLLDYEAGKFVFDEDVPQHPDYPMPEYQKFAALMAKRYSYGLFMEQGTGKTYTALSAIVGKLKERLAAGNTKQMRVIIPCPAQVMTNWEHEIQKFFPEELGDNVCIMRGQKFDRLHGLIDVLAHPSRAAIVIISYDTLKRIVDTMMSVKWDLCVADESHYGKDEKSDRSVALKNFRESCDQVLILTGTPVNNKPADLFTQLEFMGKGYSSCSSSEDFRRCFGDRIGSTNGQEAAFDTLLRMPRLKELLTGCSFRVRKADVLKDLPPISTEIIDVEMTKEQGKVYHQVRDELLSQIDEIVANAPNAAIAANNVLTKLLRLAQITSGIVVAQDEDEERVEWEFDPNAKMIVLKDTVEEWLRPFEAKDANKMIIWSCFTPDVRRIHAMCKEMGYNPAMLYGQMDSRARDKAVDSFNMDDTCRVLVGNPAAGGVGVNLLGNMGPRKLPCDTMIYYAMNWSYAVHSQSMARAHRRGTTANQVRIGYLRVPGSIDAVIGKRIEEKSETAFNILDAKALLQKA